MATVYKIEIETTSPWVNYDEKHVKEMFEKFLKEYKDERTVNKFEGTEVKVKRKA